ncbi:MAG TPA: ParB/RepB/Spo0J family partition protein [Kofleriaceae bacterium]|jgi:ParB/RepB/Spo0J family partition protein
MDTPTTTVEIAMIRVEDIVPDPRQPRKQFDPDALDQLAASITALGIIEPLVVRPTVNGQDGKPAGTPVAHFVLIAGERRWRAAKKAGIEKVPAIVRRGDGQSTHLVQLAENMEREALRPLEIAESYHRWLQPYNHASESTVVGGKLVMKPAYKLKQADLAKALGKTEAHVSQMLALRDLPAPAKRLLESDTLTFAHARALQPLAPYPSSLRAVVQLTEERARWGAVFTVRELQERVQRELTRVKERERRAAARKKTKKGKGPAVETDRQRWAREEAERTQRLEQQRQRWVAGLKVVGPQLAKRFASDSVHRLVRKIPSALLWPIASALHLPTWGDDQDVVKVLRPTTPARRVAAWLWLRSRLAAAKQQILNAGEKQAANHRAPARKAGRK